MGQKHYVGGLFNEIAERYDLLNHLLSGGIDLYWRRRAIEHVREVMPGRVLDVATGTADFAITVARLQPTEVVGVDIAENMLELGRGKLRARNLGRVVTLHHGEAENLEFTSDSFDAAIVAFGVRNFEDLERGLREMHRVLRPGGKIVVLEFSKPARFPFRQMYLFYFRRLVPLIGHIVSGHDEAYRYLPDTVMKFPEGEAFLGMLRAVGFGLLHSERLTFGIASVYTGIKP